MDKELLGFIAIIIALVAYGPYFIGIFKGRTKPHVFTWIIWGSLTAIAFVAQWTDGAGPGAWVTGFMAIVSFIIVGLAFVKGEKEVTRSDWISFLAAMGAIPLWYFTKEPLYAMILVTIIDALGFYPTFRKSYFKPYEEVAFTYALSGFKFIIALMALENFTAVTVLYPLSLVIMNGGFVVMLLWRRRVLAGKNGLPE